ncbi:MAG TPA: DUF6073 family protein [Gaiella sp.]|nr:DUF6073 family protein [Gaiella sp.]
MTTGDPPTGHEHGGHEHGAGGHGTQPIVGHHAAWGMPAAAPRIQPYTMTPGSIDTMSVRVREKIDVLGVGTDVVDMLGTFTVRRDHPCAVGDPPRVEWGESCVKTEFRSLELAGESPVFGTVRVHLSPDEASHGEVGPSSDGSLAASCVAHCFPIVELPDLGLRLTTAGQPVSLASKVIQIPPVGDVARSQNSAALVDGEGNTVGEIISSDIEVGNLLLSIPLGSTGDTGATGAHHEHGVHETASGPYFYADGQPAGELEHPHVHPPAGTVEAPQQAPGTPQDLTETLALLQRELRSLADVVGRLSQGER